MTRKRHDRAFAFIAPTYLMSADNFLSNPGSGGNTFASDDISSVHYSRIKLIHGADGTNDGDVASANPLPVRIAPIATGGCDVFRSIDLDETEEEAKGSAGTLYGILFSNLATSTRFLKLYDNTLAGTTVGSTTPKLTLALPGNASDDVSGVFAFPGGVAFGTGITAAATTGILDSDTGAPGTNEVVVNLLFK
jgi:hypothetical protein